MSLNAVYVKLLHQNWSQACRTARRLSVSLSRLENYLPVTAAIISAGDEELMERLDAFRVRYGDLQDCLGNKAFRNVLLAEDEEPVNMADTLNRIEKRGILSSADLWRNMRAIRNAFAQDAFYQDGREAEEERADAINLAWQSAGELLSIAENIQTYCRKQGVDLMEIDRADQ